MTPEDEARAAALYDDYAEWEREHEPGLSEALFALALECMTDE